VVVWLSSFVSATGRLPLGFWMEGVDVVRGCTDCFALLCFALMQRGHGRANDCLDEA
jgi:hypothetical protein